MNLKRCVFLLSIATASFLFVSCDNGTTTSETPATPTTSVTPDKLTGTWIFSTSPYVYTQNIGTLTITMNYDESINNADYWSGNGIISGSDSMDGDSYPISGIVGQAYLYFKLTGSLDSDGDGNNDSLQFIVSTDSGDTLTGYYVSPESSGPFAPLYGDFTATKQ